MAKKPESQNFVDMFANLGKDLKLPSVDVEQVIEHHRKNLEALQKSASTASSGAATVMARQREMLEETLREITDMAQNYRAPGNPQELMAKQADFARRSLETVMKNTSEMAELVRKSSEETVDVLRQRIRDGMDEIRSSYEKRS
ncbi:MAG: TIGR01841 family phasin [Rhizobiaceae bacterium]|nr:TIGR01841 family phasin [Rhizobiaceae bacterium]